MEELDLNASAVGRILGIPANRISEIVRGRRAITADTALRLSEWLGTSPEFWMRLQEKYDPNERVWSAARRSGDKSRNDAP